MRNHIFFDLLLKKKEKKKEKEKEKEKKKFVFILIFLDLLCQIYLSCCYVHGDKFFWMIPTLKKDVYIHLEI